MDIRIRYPLSRPVTVDDSWPIDLAGATVEFERTAGDISAIILTYKGQPTSAAPTLRPMNSGPVAAEIRSGGGVESDAQKFVRRFSDYVNIVFPVEIEIDGAELEFLPINDREREELKVFKFSSSIVRPKTTASFSVLAQALYAAEGVGDPSFASQLASMAREALASERYIDAFRYGFLLIEALYGGGKFKTSQLVSVLCSDEKFIEILEKTMFEFRTDNLHRRSKVKELLESYPTPQKVISHLVDRRGFYFHGNISNRNSWHPGSHTDAKEIAELSTFLAAAVAFSFAQDMFLPEIGERYFNNARAKGAILAIVIEFQYLDREGLKRRSKFNANVPGTVPTNAVAVFVHKQFLEWAETDLHGMVLVSAIGTDTGSGSTLFQSSYIDSSAPARDSDPKQ